MVQTTVPAPDATVTQFAEQLVVALREAAKGDRAHSAYGEYASGLRHDATGTPITVGYSHGPGGNFSFPGVSPEVFHTHVGHRGIIGQLPWMPSLFTNPLFQVYTGVTADTGSEKNAVCDPAPIAGLVKSGVLTSVFGRYERQTSEIELNRLGQLRDRADPLDLSLVGSPIAESGLFSTGPAGITMPPGDMLRNEVSRKMWELATSFHRLLNRQLWTGNPANNSAGGGYRELTGFNQLVTTGHVDAETNTPLPSVDSDVKNFNFLNVEDNGPALVEALTFLYYTRRTLAEQTGVMPVRWVFVISPQAWHAISAVWPCAYLTSRCELAGIDGARVNLDASAQIRLRDDMRAQRFIPIEGDRVEVIVDDGIPHQTSTTNANVPEGCFSSDIFLIPMAVAGRSVTHLEAFQFTNPSLTDALGNMVLGRIEGPWITVPLQTRWCVSWLAKVEPRLIMRTPWLAGRLDNVVTCPLQVTRSPFPDDPYHVDGGVTSRPGPSYWVPWQT